MAAEAPGLSDYNKYLKLSKDEAADIFRKTDQKQVWYNPDPKEKDTYASAVVVSESGEETVLKGEAGDVCIIIHLFIFSTVKFFLFAMITIALSNNWWLHQMKCMC